MAGVLVPVAATGLRAAFSAAARFIGNLIKSPAANAASNAASWAYAVRSGSSSGSAIPRASSGTPSTLSGSGSGGQPPSSGFGLPANSGGAPRYNLPAVVRSSSVANVPKNTLSSQLKQIQYMPAGTTVKTSSMLKVPIVAGTALTAAASVKQQATEGASVISGDGSMLGLGEWIPGSSSWAKIGFLIAGSAALYLGYRALRR